MEVPQLQCSDRVVDVPAAVHRQGLDVPVILQRQVHADNRRCLRFSSSHELGYDGSEEVFWRILRHFSRSSGHPELSASFRSWEPSMMKSSSSSRAGGVALTPGVSPRCQATSCA